jgi:hypothetical protein
MSTFSGDPAKAIARILGSAGKALKFGGEEADKPIITPFEQSPVLTSVWMESVNNMMRGREAGGVGGSKVPSAQSIEDVELITPRQLSNIMSHEEGVGSEDIAELLQGASGLFISERVAGDVPLSQALSEIMGVTRGVREQLGAPGVRPGDVAHTLLRRARTSQEVTGQGIIRDVSKNLAKRLTVTQLQGAEAIKGLQLQSTPARNIVDPLKQAEVSQEVPQMAQVASDIVGGDMGGRIAGVIRNLPVVNIAQEAVIDSEELLSDLTSAVESISGLTSASNPLSIIQQKIADIQPVRAALTSAIQGVANIPPVRAALSSSSQGGADIPPERAILSSSSASGVEIPPVQRPPLTFAQQVIANIHPEERALTVARQTLADIQPDPGRILRQSGHFITNILPTLDANEDGRAGRQELAISQTGRDSGPGANFYRTNAFLSNKLSPDFQRTIIERRAIPMATGARIQNQVPLVQQSNATYLSDVNIFNTAF